MILERNKRQKVITGIGMGLADGKVAWVFQYQDGRRESFALHPSVARQFMQGLQELVLRVEQPARVGGEALSWGNGVDIRLQHFDQALGED